MAMITNTGMPHEFWKWELIRETGWSLEYVDALTVADFNEWVQVRDGVSKGRNSLVR